MTSADWVILVVIALMVFAAAINGFFQEAIGIAGLVVGYLLAAWQYKSAAYWFMPYLKSHWLAELVGYFAIFAAVMIVAALLGRVLRWAVRKTGLSKLDRFMGGLLGLVKGGLTVAVALTAITAFQPASTWLAGSLLTPYFLVLGRAAVWVAPTEMRMRFYEGLEKARQQNPVWDASQPR